MKKLNLCQTHPKLYNLPHDAKVKVVESERRFLKQYFLSTPNQKQEPWSSNWNSALIEQGIQANSKKQEIIRYSVMIETAFDTFTTEHGDDFTSNIILTLSERYYHSDKVEAILKNIGKEPPACSEDKILSAKWMCNKIARTLTTNLKYEDNEALNIFSKAFETFLDNHFLVSKKISCTKRQEKPLYLQEKL